MIREVDIEAACDFLREGAEDAAQARADRVYLEEFRKSLKAQIMAEHAEKPIGAQEREAYSDQRYLDHLDAIRIAVHNDEKARFLRQAALAKIESWRTQEANRRGMDRV